MSDSDFQPNLILHRVRLSFLHVFEPRPLKKEDIGTGKKPKYQATLVLEPGHPQIEAAQRAFVAAVQAKFGAKWEAMVADPNFHRPLIKSAIHNERYGYPEGSIFIRANNEKRPGVVDANVQAVLDRDQVYAGVYANVSVRPFVWSREKSGCTFNLNNIQVLGYGERWDSRMGAEDEFEPVAGSGSGPAPAGVAPGKVDLATLFG